MTRHLLLIGALALFTLAPQDAGKKAMPEIGKPAPTLRLNDHNGQIVSRGGAHDSWTVLAFFPKAATPG